MPVITLVVFMGAWLASSNIGDWIVLLIFGVVGYVMKQGAVPRPPMVLGFVIGPIMENALFITTNAYDGLSWLGRPICLVIGLLIVVSIVAGVRQKARHPDGKRILVEFGRADPTMSLLAVGMLLAFSILRTGTYLLVGRRCGSDPDANVRPSDLHVPVGPPAKRSRDPAIACERPGCLLDQN